MRDEPPSYIGFREVWDEGLVGLPQHDRRQHLYIIGQTGAGKTTLLRNLIIQDIHAGRGVGLIDPHGDLAAELLDEVPSHRTDDVVYFNAGDFDYPIGLNPLETVSGDAHDLTANSVVEAFKAIWHESWGPRLEYLLYAAVRALLECENVSLLGVYRMFLDERYRAWVVKQVRDPAVRRFWITEFEQYDKRFRQEAVSPILNKVGRLIMSPPLRNMLGQVTSGFDPLVTMDRSQIFIANLAKGRLGGEPANLLGSLVVSQFQLAAMRRATRAEAERTPFHLHVDEFHNFTTEAFGEILAESRKYGLHLALAHQHMGQLSPVLRDATLGNVGSLVSFRVGEPDSEALGPYFRPYEPTALSELRNYRAAAKLMEGGRPMGPYRLRMGEPLACGYGRGTIVIGQSRRRFATPRAVIEDKIRRWMGA